MDDVPSVSAAAELDRLHGELGAVDDALRRLDDGSYGSCERCGAPLGDDRLEDDPTAARCRACGPGGAPPST
jgi:DnaK suppressor protein